MAAVNSSFIFITKVQNQGGALLFSLHFGFVSVPSHCKVTTDTCTCLGFNIAVLGPLTGSLFLLVSWNLIMQCVIEHPALYGNSQHDNMNGGAGLETLVGSLCPCLLIMAEKLVAKDRCATSFSSLLSHLIPFLLPEFSSSADLHHTPFTAPLPPSERRPLPSPPALRVSPSFPPSLSSSTPSPPSFPLYLHQFRGPAWVAEFNEFSFLSAAER